mgnify:CR=1 FL=1
MIPISHGWLSPKFYEMILHGIIPFIHPNYDTDCNLDVHSYLRLEKPGDLYERIKYLENNESLAKYNYDGQIFYEVCNEPDEATFGVGNTLEERAKNYGEILKKYYMTKLKYNNNNKDILF